VNSSRNGLYQEAKEVSGWLNAYSYKIDDVLTIEIGGNILKSHVKDTCKKIEQGRFNSAGIRKVLLGEYIDLLLNHSKERAQEFKCLCCAVTEMSVVFNCTDYNKSDLKLSAYSKTENVEFIQAISIVFVFLQTTHNLSHDADKCINMLVDIWEKFIDNLTNNTLNSEDRRKEVDEVTKEKPKQEGEPKNCGFGSECRFRPILWTLYLIAITGNGLLILIFVRNREMRTGRNMIILNLAVADIFSVLCNAFIQTLFIYGETYEHVRVIYGIINLFFEVTTCVCIYSVVALSIQKYFAVLPAFKCDKYGISKRFRSAVFICLLWITACVPQIIELTSDISPRLWALRNLILYCVLPIVAMATFYMMTSWRLRQSVRKIPGEPVLHVTIKHARVRSSNVLIALIAVFVVSYTPIQIFRFTEIWFRDGDYLFDYVDLVAYSLISLNSCFNPIALYVASAKFRLYYNKYLCCRNIEMENKQSMTNTNLHTMNNTFVLHV
jgi:hypothetical protein